MPIKLLLVLSNKMLLDTIIIAIHNYCSSNPSICPSSPSLLNILNYYLKKSPACKYFYLYQTVFLTVWFSLGLLLAVFTIWFGMWNWAVRFVVLPRFECQPIVCYSWFYIVLKFLKSLSASSHKAGNFLHFFFFFLRMVDFAFWVHWRTTTSFTAIVWSPWPIPMLQASY